MLETQTDNRGAIQTPGVNLKRAMQSYLANAAYRALPMTEGNMLFAVHKASNRGVAFQNGNYDRNALRQLMTEVKSIGLSGHTVLVNGLITYSGNGATDVEIRVDGGMDFNHISEDIVKAQMRDVRASKRQATNDGENIVESQGRSPRPRC